MQEPRTDPPASLAVWGFGLAVAVVLAAALSQALELARAEWFSRDDFVFLLRMQHPVDWTDVFLPRDGSSWWAWRPIGMDGFFRVGFLVFGREPFGYFAVALGVHLALGPVAWALARSVGFAPPAAVCAGVLTVLAPPALTGFAYASVFHYLAANLLGGLALLAFVAGLAPGAWLVRAASSLCFAAALLCNEAVLVLPVVACLLALQRAPGTTLRTRTRAALRAVAPLLAVAAVWGVLRFAVVELADPPSAYRIRFDRNLLRHYWLQPHYRAGGGARLAAAVVGMVGVWVLCAWRARSGEPAPLRALLRATAWLLPWCLVAIAVFAPLPFSHPRFAITLTLPGALLLAAHLDALWRLYAPRHATALRVAFALLLLLALPLSALREHTREPRGEPARRFVEGVARLHPRPPPGALLVVVYDDDGLASRRALGRLRRSTYSGTAIRAMHSPQLGAVRFVDAATAREHRCARCLYVALGADLSVEAWEP